MLSGKGKIRLALFVVAAISLAVAAVSISYLNSMAQRIEVIVRQDERLVELAEGIAIRMLEARREEKNFIIYLDSVYIDNNRRIMDQVRSNLLDARAIPGQHGADLDSISQAVARYEKNIQSLMEIFQENPRALQSLQRQLIGFEDDLKRVAKTRDTSYAWTSEINMSLLAASTKISAEKARIISELKQSSDIVLVVADRIASSTRRSLTKHSEEGMRFGVKAQRNTLTIFIITAVLLGYLIFYLPQQIFSPVRKMVKVLRQIEQGDTEVAFSEVTTGGEFVELARSFQDAIKKLRYFDDLKTARIVELEKELQNILAEVKEEVLVLTPDLKIIFINERAQKLFGLEGELMNVHIKDLPSIWKVLGRPLEQIEKQGRFDFPATIKNEGERKRRVHVLPVIGSGRFESILVIMK